MVKVRRALSIGAKGQDGTYLSELLLDKGYQVHALSHSARLGSPFYEGLRFRDGFFPLIGSASDPAFIQGRVKELMPDEIYYLSSNHELEYSMENYEKSRSVNLDGLSGALNGLVESSNPGRLFYASSSNIFLNADCSPQSESTPHAPGTLYGLFKSTAMMLIGLYRQKYGIYACSGILYNHESPRRHDFFLPKKIVRAAVAIKNGEKIKLQLGDLHAVRDWGYAGDYVLAMWMMLQGDSPKDYVIGAGKTRSVEWVLDFVFTELDLDWREYVVSDASLIRDSDIRELKADIAKIKLELGWEPSTDFPVVLKMMIAHEMNLSKKI